MTKGIDRIRETGNRMKKKIHVLYAEDNPQDADMTQAHFQREASEFELEIVRAGQRCLNT